MEVRVPVPPDTPIPAEGPPSQQVQIAHLLRFLAVLNPVLDDIESCLENYADGDGDAEQPYRPNKAFALLTRLREARG